MHAPYVELRCRSAFSFLEGASTPEDLIAIAASHGHAALALADRDGVYGAPRFWKAGKAHGVRTIVGAEVTIAYGRDAKRTGRVLLLAASRVGYRNLCKLITRGRARAAKGESLVHLDEVEDHSAGLICLAGGDRSLLLETLRSRDELAVLRIGRRLQGTFGNRLWIDLQRSIDPQVERRTRVLQDVAARLRLPIVATGDVRMARCCEQPVLDVLCCLGRHTRLDVAGRVLLPNAERSLVSPREMAARFRDLPRAVSATLDIAEQCEFSLDDLGYRFPEVPLPPGETPIGRLRALTYEGARDRYGAKLEGRVSTQLEHELNIIEKLDLAGYFLIVWDIVRFCRERRILVQGRGSAANSAVCYALGITAVDAVGMELLFERFLSEERGEWPDIDLDLPSGDHREEVIQYVYRRYGPRGPTPAGQARTIGSGVAMTANVITYRVRSALREAGKVLGFAEPEIERLSKLLAHHGFHDQRDVLEAQLASAGVDVTSERVRLLVDCVEKLQGLPRHLGQHSGGMIVAAGRLDEIVPLEPATMPGRSVVQWDKDDCADLGLIKIDLLGLGMMAVLEEAIPLARDADGVELDLAKMPQNDARTYEMIRRADTIGVFQIESRAQMATLPRLKPKTFYDLVVEVAIIRPGPIVGQMVHPYLNRRAGREEIRYPHPLLEPILRRTLGVPLFQEQLLRVAMTVAGFTGGEAEELRRAMGFKRSVQRMRSIEQKLRDGLAAHDIVGDAADEIVRSITSFALYGFPESHAASFALIAYASAYLKAHHPEAFLCALLNAWPMGFYHPATLVKDAERHGVEVLPIDATSSDWCCTIERRERDRRDGQRRRRAAVRLGLRFARGLREEAGRSIVRARADRPFEGLADLAARTRLVERELATLADLGALGAFSHSRRAAAWQVRGLAPNREPLLAGIEIAERDQPGQPMSPLEETLADYRSSGMTTGPHLMAHFRAALRRREVSALDRLREAPDGARLRTAGLVIVRQRPGTAKGICFLTLEDETGTGNAVVMPDCFAQYRVLLHTAALLIVEGTVQRHEGVVHLKVAKMWGFSPGDTPSSHDFH
ncbi:error-prone DNA polymerase [Candidatus Binatia bacterium]|nr:error-prone DNA polymerase [Candidatus Binatia bacterium]